MYRFTVLKCLKSTKISVKKHMRVQYIKSLKGFTMLANIHTVYSGIFVIFPLADFPGEGGKIYLQAGNSGVGSSRESIPASRQLRGRKQ